MKFITLFLFGIFLFHGQLPCFADQKSSKSVNQDKDYDDEDEDDDSDSALISSGWETPDKDIENRPTVYFDMSYGYGWGIKGEILDRYRKDILDGKKANGQVFWPRVYFPFIHQETTMIALGLGFMHTETEIDKGYQEKTYKIKDTIQMLGLEGIGSLALSQWPKISVVANLGVGWRTESAEIFSGTGKVSQDYDDIAAFLEGGVSYSIIKNLSVSLNLLTSAPITFGTLLGVSYGI